MASEALAAFTKDEIEYYHQISKEKYELDMQSRMVYERRQGRQEGRQEGKQEGKLEEKQEVITLLKSGKSLEEILKEYEGK
ncbi:MAG: hypothetical protein FWD26_07265 [Treponema sp.]|nr:hypothetical protein [Treponema sp.]